MTGALILAGGGSLRMGRDKAWLDLDGRPLLIHVLTRLAPRCSPLVIGAAPGQELPPWDGIPELEAVTIERVDDPSVDAGPLVGVAGGLARLDALGVSRAYVSSCDAAGLSPGHVAFMLEGLEQLRREDPGVSALVPMDAEGRRHPLAAAVVVKPMLARAQALLDAGEARLQLWVDEARTVPAAALPDPLVLEPCNTPQQWRAWQGCYFPPRSPCD